MRFLSIALFGLASISTAAAADYKTWNEVVGDVPQCIKKCYTDFYDDSGLKDECGSADDATVDCLCGVKGSISSVSGDATKLSNCIEDGCSTEDLTNASSELSDFVDRLSDVLDTCSSKKNAAVSLAPGAQAFIASGAVLLMGAAL